MGAVTQILARFRPRTLQWLVLALFLALFPLGVNAFFRMGKGWESFFELITYSLLPSVAFGILAGTMSDMVLANRHPGTWYIVFMILIGLPVTALLAYGSVYDTEKHEWFHFAAVFTAQTLATIFTIGLCAFIKDAMLTLDEQINESPPT